MSHLSYSNSPTSNKKFLSRKKKKRDTKHVLCGFKRYSQKIPPIIEQTCSYLEQHALQNEGIFRVSGSQDTIRSIKDKFEKGKKIDLSKELNPNNVAGVLKLFFKELPNPIMTHELYPALLQACTIGNQYLRLWCIRQAIDVLPIGNKIVLHRIMTTFFTISQFEKDNKMSAKNIALVMNPVLFREPGDSVQGFMENGIYRVQLVETIIRHCTELFNENKEILNEKVKKIGNITKDVEDVLIEFTQLLKHNAITLANTIIQEGGTEIAVSFKNFSNMESTIEQWRKPEFNDKIESIPLRSSIRKNSTRSSIGTFVSSKNTEVISIDDVPLRNKSLRKQKSKRRSFKRLSSGKFGKFSFLSGRDDSSPKENFLHTKKSRSVLHSNKINSKTNGLKQLAIEADIDLPSLFECMINGDLDVIKQHIMELPPDTRSLLIFKLQRSTNAFIKVLDDCK